MAKNIMLESQRLDLSDIACLVPWRNMHPSHSQGTSEKWFAQPVGRMPRLIETQVSAYVDKNIGFSSYGVAGLIQKLGK